MANRKQRRIAERKRFGSRWSGLGQVTAYDPAGKSFGRLTNATAKPQLGKGRVAEPYAVVNADGTPVYGWHKNTVTYKRGTVAIAPSGKTSTVRK